ncbi:MAG: hypothetical protein K2X71_27490 [Methylobacterium sp.]|uniref:hypothetical protein n=1 Tax=Methylobacterium sp. TaxID=409 RepID=UPI00258CD284|nr:hypothetical protein [Methylobacterium sp.]MBY0299736.1 hypothetical protein [Methylobacterium sp.]
MLRFILLLGLVIAGAAPAEAAPPGSDARLRARAPSASAVARFRGPGLRPPAAPRRFGRASIEGLRRLERMR